MNDADWMSQAIAQARLAEAAGEVPVGAVLVLNGECIAAAYNCPITTNDPSAHAEIAVLRAGAKALGNYRLLDCTLYVTLEPCAMCAGAMVHARVKRVVYGASDAKAGAVSSQLSLLDQAFLNHRVLHEGGVMAAECGALLSEFFKKKRSLSSGVSDEKYVP
jgi:tRNA(adenine34) deaminase